MMGSVKGKPVVPSVNKQEDITDDRGGQQAL